MRLILALIALLATACAPTWVRPGVSLQEIQRDGYECRAAAEQVMPPPSGPYGGLVLASAQVAWLQQRNRMTEQCMRSRGYREAGSEQAVAENCAGQWAWQGDRAVCR